jgi:DNA-binding PadR family transcriptional regulator
LARNWKFESISLQRRVSNEPQGTAAHEGRDVRAAAYSPSPGVIYPTLTLLEELGYVTVSTGESAKKLHEIAAEGRAFLAANHRTVDALFIRMGEISRAHGGGTAPQILRAMENLKLALRLRLSRGPLNEEQINAAAALIDAAATGVEQIT